MVKTIYFDNGATTKVDEKALEVMIPFLSNVYGNPSSNHAVGFEALDAMEDARNFLAKSIGAKPDEIIFTSGGTESNNAALKGVAFANRNRGNHIITTAFEHKSILKTLDWLSTQGFEITKLPLDEDGFVNPKDLENAITDKTILVTIVHGNNEVGTIQDLESLGKICKEKNVYFHTDACQSYTKTELDVNKQNLDLVSLNSHKIHGPKGVGLLYVRKGTKLDPLLHGGGQENNLRAGTQNVPAIVGFAEAVRQSNKKSHVEKMRKFQNQIITTLTGDCTAVTLNGPSAGENRLCNNINLSFKAVEGEAIGGLLDQMFIEASTGSACSSLSLDPSYVLKAIGMTDEEANGSLRVSISRFTTQEEVDRFLETVPKVIKKLRKISPFGKLLDKLSINGVK